MADSAQDIFTFEKNSREEVRVAIEEFGGRKIINIRVFYRDEASGEMRPGKQGLALSLDRYRDLAAAVLWLGERLQKEGLLPGASA